MRFYRPGLLHYLSIGNRLQDYFGWGRPIFSATAGIVAQAEDGLPERNPVHPVRDYSTALKNARIFNQNRFADLRLLTGNFIIIEANYGFAVYAHAQNGSIVVSPGDRVVPGQMLAKVGHSGNSTAPHLHFH
jgi:murein DD-endopeptidase MepM/ murein hydrolase activator NlpD